MEEPWGEAEWTARDQLRAVRDELARGSFEDFTLTHAYLVLGLVVPLPYAPEPPPVRWVRGLIITLILVTIFEFEMWKIGETIARARHGG